MSEVKERWLPVPGYEGLYEISDRGRLLSHHRKTPIIRRPKKMHRYLSVGLYGRDGVCKHWTIHRLVMLAFVGPLPKGWHTRHLDGDGYNNCLTNLAYGTPADNARDGIRLGRNPKLNRTHCINGHEYTAENLGNNKTRDHRTCLACIREAAARARAAKRAALNLAAPRATSRDCRHCGRTFDPRLNYSGAYFSRDTRVFCSRECYRLDLLAKKRSSNAVVSVSVVTDDRVVQ